MSIVLALLGALRAALRSRTDLALENLALGQQLVLLRRHSKRPQFGRLDRILWIWLSTRWAGRRDALHIVRPETVIRWHRRRVLYVFVVLLHHRRQILHFNVTDSPTVAWTAQQLVEAFPDDSAPRYLLRDRDSIYGAEFRRWVKGMGIAEIPTAARSPWQNPFAERVIGTIRRELLDHVIIQNERHLRRRLRSYVRYYHGSRTHLALEKDAPGPRAVEPPENGRVFAVPHVGGLHHRYVRRAA